MERGIEKVPGTRSVPVHRLTVWLGIRAVRADTVASPKVVLGARRTELAPARGAAREEGSA